MENQGSALDDVFLWLVQHNAIFTWDNLQRREWKGPNICPMCEQGEETTKYIFVMCTYSMQIWEFMNNLGGHMRILYKRNKRYMGRP